MSHPKLAELRCRQENMSKTNKRLQEIEFQQRKTIQKNLRPDGLCRSSQGKKSLCYFNNIEAKNAIERKQNDHTHRQKTVLEKNKTEKQVLQRNP